MGRHKENKVNTRHARHARCPGCTGNAPRTGIKGLLKSKLFLTLCFVALVLVLNIILVEEGIMVLAPFASLLYEYAQMLWFPILLGLLIGGVIDHFVPREYIVQTFAKHKKKTILYSVGLGFIMSACSHGILAIAMELYKKGASTPSVIAFLLASPWANLPVTILLFGLFRIRALFFIGSAIIVAIITGLVYQKLDELGLVECKGHHESKNNAGQIQIFLDAKRRLTSYKPSLGKILEDIKGVGIGTFQLAEDILWWIIIGTVLASAAGAYIPKGIFAGYMGPTLPGLLVTLALATVIEVCSEGTAPLAFEIYRQTGAFGNAFAFLMAGVATDYTEIGLIWSRIGKRAALWLPVVTVPQVIFLGLLFNWLL